jgi:hypothetical protein
MAKTLAEFLRESTAARGIYPATAFYPVVCPCGSLRFRLERARSITLCLCVRCNTKRFIDRFGTDTGWDEAVEDQEGAEEFWCEACDGEEAEICLGFAGYPEAPELDAVKWFYVGVRCCGCGVDTCFNDGKVGRGPMSESTFRDIAGEA